MISFSMHSRAHAYTYTHNTYHQSSSGRGGQLKPTVIRGGGREWKTGCSKVLAQQTSRFATKTFPNYPFCYRKSMLCYTNLKYEIITCISIAFMVILSLITNMSQYIFVSITSNISRFHPSHCVVNVYRYMYIHIFIPIESSNSCRNWQCTENKRTWLENTVK